MKIKTNSFMYFACLFILLGLGVNAASAVSLQVKVTNLTKDQRFTPILASSQTAAVDVFSLGTAASTELEAIAEGGDTTGLSDLLTADENVLDVQTSEGLLEPGSSTMVIVDANRRTRYLSLASMLIPTNDAFIGLSSYPAPRRLNDTVTVYLNAYDAGTEINDELCSSIPGPGFTECTTNNTTPEPSGTDVGFVHIHNGIHGVGDLNEANRDWRNPVAKVEITRIR